MNRRRNLIGRIPLGLVAVLLVPALVLFGQLRPPLPSLPRSLSEPVALWQVEEILLFLAWLAVVALLLLLLALIVRTVLQRSPPRVPLALRRDADRDPRRGGALPGALARPKPLARPYVLAIAAPDHDGNAQRAATGGPTPVATMERPQTDDRTEHQRSVTIRLLGPPAIEGLPRRRRGLRTDCRLFLIYLALHPKGVGRDTLAAALWPDLPDRRARQRLYQAASDARSRLGDAFVADGDRYWLDRDRVDVDVEHLQRLLREAKASDASTERHVLEQAFALVGGEPLSGLDVAWADGEARRLRAVVVDLCVRLGSVRLAGGDPAGALAAAERGIDLDALNEELWRLALEAEGALGLRDAVIKRYETLCQRLDERLGLEPQRETRSAYLSLLAQD
jgi:DNA-binding SARP family transcriptional activator